MKSWKQPTNEMIEKVLASVKKETDRQYFFSRLNNPLWMGPLRERGYFNKPPGLKKLPDGYVQYPHWPELGFLANISEEVPDQVVDIILSFPKTDNPRVYDDILAICLRLKGQQSAMLLPKLIEYITLDNPFFVRHFPELLSHWAEEGNIAEALQIAALLIPFQEDLRAREKQRLRKTKPNSAGTSLEPTPRFQQFQYQQILEEGVRSLAECAPYQVSSILIDAVANMIQLRVHQDDLDKGNDNDYSEVWCRRLDKSVREDHDVKEILVQTLTYVCEQVYNNASESIDRLDRELRYHRWQVFKRIRQHLYALHPNEQTFPWIREQILGHNDYSKWEHHYEFQLMIRKACECFGSRLLSQDEQEDIFAAILRGPSKEEFCEWMGKDYTEVKFQKRKRYFHCMQLRPFAALLSGDLQQYLYELEGEFSVEAVTDDSYSPYGGVAVGMVTYRSPKSEGELDSLTDEELLTYLNDWNEEYRDKDNWLVEINISALSDVFQCLFKEKIVPDGERLTFWLTNRDRIFRPIYVVAMLKAMIELVKEKNFDCLDQWIEFCGWVLSHSDTERMEGQPEPRDESRDHPDWGSSRRAVVDFVDACVNQNTDAPIVARDGLGSLLCLVCGQPDWRLDHGHSVLINRDDPITEAINYTRSRALESLVNYGFWIHRRVQSDQLQEVTRILANRMAKDAEIPLTRPEHALLGMHFGNLCTLNRDWAAQQREVLFPKADEGIWRDAFGSFVRFNRPVKPTFAILRSEFEFAIENLNILTNDVNDGKELVDRLGQHIFTYYLWEIYPLRGNESLLDRFYEKTIDDRIRWGKLFDYVGRSLRNSDRQLERMLSNRIIAFFDWRFEAAEPLELQEFTFWLDAECLNSVWRLQSYSKILDISQGNDVGLSLQVSALNKLLPSHLELVVECFAKITNAMDQDTQMYVSANEATPILKAGLTADDPRVRNSAERAREDLLRLGRFDFLGVE